MNTTSFLERHRHRVELITGAAVLAFGWVLGGLVAMFLVVSLLVGMVDVLGLIGRIN